MKEIEAEINELILDLSQQNAGAISVLIQLKEQNDVITLLLLDMLDIKASKIWCLYKDSCKEDLKSFQTLVFSEAKARCSEPTLKKGVSL